MSGPAIGICAAFERARWGPWEDTVTMLPRSYATSVQAAGALALLLPPDGAATEAPDPLLDRIEGLMLAGGGDVDPASYGAQRHPETAPPGPSAIASRSPSSVAPSIAGCPCWASAGVCR